ncbi:hypothetical protein PV328_004062 [Microctonus aethiopoides]|uniref:Exonuclease domain-containing protein n=1 Tax=Microctonus aethiopoides TaxID=144406 RepID=A0AA39F9Y0_9HYME|nr:hypothetical protein PV328_004062 [Microctonus aethiopoides]
MCDGGHKLENHDCNKNFKGTAKSMEPASAIIITCKNSNLKDANMEIGVLIADNDSGTIAALRERCNHEVVKHSDMNHTSTGVANQLYKLRQEKSYKELNCDSIKWIQRCFTYCVTQHDRDVDDIKQGLLNISEHAFNNHANCDPSWCDYYKDKENYTHSVIGAGFKNENLYNDLKIMFQNLANRAQSYCAGASSNCNESFNHMYTTLAPKKCNYGLSGSGKTRLQIAKKKESKEGITYESNIGLLSSVDVSIDEAEIDDSLSPIIVIFDLETGDFALTADILQISALYEDYAFNVYIRPTKKISPKATEVHKIEYTESIFTVDSKIIGCDEIFSLQDAMNRFYSFLTPLKRKIILTAHNCAFDRPRIIAAFQKTYMLKYFQNLIHGFCDTLPLIRPVTSKTKKNANILETLAKQFGMDVTTAHNAIEDCKFLAKILIKLEISNYSMINASKSMDAVLLEIQKKNETRKKMKTLHLDELEALCTRPKNASSFGGTKDIKRHGSVSREVHYEARWVENVELASGSRDADRKFVRCREGRLPA